MDATPSGLRAVHRQIRLLEKRRGIVVASVRDRNSNARADVDLVAANEKTAANSPDDFFRQQGGRRTRIIGDMYDYELVAAEASAEVPRTNNIRQVRGDFLQKCVAGLMPQSVVDVPESLKVN